MTTKGKTEILHNAKGKEICGAKRRNKDATCQSTVLLPSGRCRIHGGKTPGGMENANYKHGKYSRYRLKSDELHKRFMQAIEDQNLLSLREDVALIDVKIGEIVETIHEPASWDEAHKAFERLRLAVTQKDAGHMNAALQDLEQSFDSFKGEKAAWDDLLRILDHRRKLVESERKRMVELQQYVAVERIMGFINSLQEILKQNVDDPDKRRIIASKIRRLVGSDQPVS